MNSRTSRLSLALLAAALLAACANIPTPSQPTTLGATAAPTLSMALSSPLPTSTPSWLPVTDGPVFLQAGQRVRVEHEYLDRYMCLTGEPLMCQCFSRLSQACYCDC